MKLRVLGSGSSGNCILLENENEVLLLDAGVNFSVIKQAVNFKTSKIVGACVTHSHMDHARSVKELLKYGIKVFSPYSEYGRNHCIFGNFMIECFPLVHDVSNFGFLIKHPDFGKLLYATDTEYIKWNFAKSNIKHFLVEANYDPQYMIMDSKSKADHVYLGHMSIDTCVGFLEKNVTDNTKTILLCHMSHKNAYGEDFIAKVEERIDCEGKLVEVAKKGLEIYLTL